MNEDEEWTTRLFLAAWQLAHAMAFIFIVTWGMHYTRDFAIEGDPASAIKAAIMLTGAITYGKMLWGGRQ